MSKSPKLKHAYCGDPEALFERLLRNCELFSSFLKRERIETPPYIGKSIERAKELESLSLAEILKHFEAYFALLVDAKKRGADLKHAAQLSWAALHIHGLRPHSSFLEKIERDDVVEFYNGDHVQIFRNLRFFELVSYDILSVITLPWHDLYERDESFHIQAFKEVDECLDEAAETLPFSLPEHRLVERISSEKRRFRIRHKWRGPLWQKNNREKGVQGVIMTSEAHRIVENE